MARKGSGNRRLGDAAEKIIKRLDRTGTGLRQVRAARAWRAVAGEMIGAHTSGAFVRGRQMVVYVDSPVWAAELQAMAERFRVAVNEEAGEELVSSMRFTVSRQPADGRGVEGDNEEEAEPERVEATEEEREAVWVLTEAVADRSLREAAFRARLADFEWKKGSEPRNSAQKPSGGARRPKSGD